MNKRINNTLKYTGEMPVGFYNSKAPAYFLIGTPYHTNIGDRAIAHAEIEFIQKINKEKLIVEVPFMTDISSLVISNKDTIVFHGGGNLGDIWPEEEEYRQRVMAEHFDKKIIIMPQTIFFEDALSMKKSLDIYSKCRNLTILAREKTSYDNLKNNFLNNEVELIPDIVLSLGLPYIVRNRQRSYALFSLRRDKERTTPDSIIHRTEDVLKYEAGIDDFVYSDMHCDENEAFVNSHKFIANFKIDQFSRAKIVVTDRLHGMIFATITGTPCIVFGSRTPKTRGTYEIIRQTRAGRYIRMCDQEDDVSRVVHEIISQKSHTNSLRGLSRYWVSLKKILES